MQHSVRYCLEQIALRVPLGRGWLRRLRWEYLLALELEALGLEVVDSDAHVRAAAMLPGSLVPAVSLGLLWRRGFAPLVEEDDRPLGYLAVEEARHGYTIPIHAPIFGGSPY